MKSNFFNFLALTALIAGWFSCTNDADHLDNQGFKWDGSLQKEEFLPINSGTDSSSFAIDRNIVSFAVPYLVGTTASEHPSTPGWGSPEGFSPHFWTLVLVFTKGTDVRKLAPTITLAPGATITEIHHTIGLTVLFDKVNYTGIAEVGMKDFSKQVDFVIVAPDGSTVKYKFLAVAIGDVLPCGNCTP